MARVKLSLEAKSRNAQDAAEDAAQRDGTREAWLESALPYLHLIFADAGYIVPPVRVSCSFGGGKASAVKAIGQCWPKARSAAGINEVFLSPVLDDPLTVLDVFVHELAHAVDDCQSGHGRGYKKIATAVGLEGKMRYASAGEALRMELGLIVAQLPPYPHKKLNAAIATKPRRKKSRSFTCEECAGSFTYSVNRLGDVKCCPFCETPNSELIGESGGDEGEGDE